MCHSCSYDFDYCFFVIASPPKASPPHMCYFSCLEKRRNTAMNMSNSMAFISQFAEYNPGGGKDEVLKYLNEAQTQVILAEKALKVILECVTSSAA